MWTVKLQKEKQAKAFGNTLKVFLEPLAQRSSATVIILCNRSPPCPCTVVVVQISSVNRESPPALSHILESPKVFMWWLSVSESKYITLKCTKEKLYIYATVEGSVALTWLSFHVFYCRAFGPVLNMRCSILLCNIKGLKPRYQDSPAAITVGR